MDHALRRLSIDFTLEASAIAGFHRAVNPRARAPANLPGTRARTNLAEKNARDYVFILERKRYLCWQPNDGCQMRRVPERECGR
jgi:hypothetical protein